MALSHLTEMRLMKLFTVTGNNELSPRGRGILDELRQRGYFFDVHRGEFLTSEQWKLRYWEALPAPAVYVVYLRQHTKRRGENS